MIHDDVVLIELPEFIRAIKDLIGLKQWKPVEDSAIAKLFESFPVNAATKQPLVDAEDFYEALDRITECRDRTVPGDVKWFYQEVRREKTIKLFEQDAKPSLPKPIDTRNLQNQEGGEAYVRFKRFHRDLMALRKEGRKSFTKAEYQEKWNAPLTREDWELASNTSPAEAIAGALSGSVPRPDPKEWDLVWMS